MKGRSLIRNWVKYLKTLEYEQSLKIIYYFSIFFGFIIRLVLSLNSWGMKHPDEIYQSLEMAHYLVYGEGYIPPEFQSSNSTIPSYAAARSWLFPMFFSIFMYLGEFLGLEYLNHTLPLIKFYMAVHATFLIPAVYKLTHELSDDKLTATISAFLIAFWFRVIEYTIRTFTNTFFLPMIFYGIYLVLHHSKRDTLSLPRIFEIGFFLGISTYIRVDLGIIIFAFFLVYFQSKHLLNYFKIGIVSFLFWVWGALIDYNTYTDVKFFSVIINWFTFNVIKGYSKFFGVSGPFDYLSVVIVKDLLIPWLVIMVIWPIISYFRSSRYSIFKSEIGKVFKKLAAVNIIIWFIFSYPVSFRNLSINYSHKEIRFVIGAVVVLLILIAVLIRMMVAELSRVYVGLEKETHDSFSMKSFEIKQVRRYFIVLFLTVFLVTSFIANSYRNPGDMFEGFNRSYTYIGNQGDAEQIITLEVWYVTGYYTYSHASADVQFFHYQLKDPVSINRINLIKTYVYNQNNGTYFVIPWYAYNQFEQASGDSLESLLLQYDWTMVYQYDGVFTWTV